MDSFNALKRLLAQIREQVATEPKTAGQRKAQVSETLAKLQAIRDGKKDQ